MIDEYFSGVKRLITESFKGEHNDLEIKKYYDDIFKRLNDDRYLGNLLSHNDEDNSYVSIKEIEDFRDLVFEFEKAMKCDKHHSKLFPVLIPNVIL